MNEGFSDIWGACVEYFAAPGKSTWLIEKILKEEPVVPHYDPMVIPSQKDNLIPTVYLPETTNCGSLPG
jgi:hypothetical protein